LRCDWSGGIQTLPPSSSLKLFVAHASKMIQPTSAVATLSSEVTWRFRPIETEIRSAQSGDLGSSLLLVPVFKLQG
ncbi:hypothetical protein, partial [Cohaesibacter celericrescens]|uniref:hypothetical protein n=1 Tax=Cohaesibacter celericrescens TaxID=2067669 RepID=UPI003562B2B0